MKKSLFPLLAVICSTSTCTLGPDDMLWGVFGHLAVSTETPSWFNPTVPVVSTAPATNVVVCSEQSPNDCYKLKVTPNGTWSSQWVTRPQ